MRLHRTFAAIAALSLTAFPVHATTFTDGEFVTYSQGLWGHSEDGGPEDPTVATLLENNFDAIFAPYGGYLEVGIPGPAGFSMIFADADSVIAYLPATGVPGPLTDDLLDPTSSASGDFGGEVVGLALNLAFSDAGLLAHPPGVAFGALVFQNLDTLVGQPTGNPAVLFGPEITALDGEPVRDLLADAEPLLGGGTSPFNVWELLAILGETNRAFNGGEVAAFADENLELPGSSALAPEPLAWPVLLIGLAGLGFVRYRGSRMNTGIMN